MRTGVATARDRRTAPAPGVTLHTDGAEFAVFSRHADGVDVCLFDPDGDRELARWRLGERIGDIHFGFVPGIRQGGRYGLRADGPNDPGQGHYFDPAKLLVDPTARLIDRPFRYVPELAASRDVAIDTAPYAPRAIVCDGPAFQAHRKPPVRRTGLVYEVGVRAFSKLRNDLPLELRGTLAALARPELIAHFHKIGVTTIELMPIAAAMDERHLPPLGLTNAWGYNPVVMMALDPRLVPRGIAELQTAVRALHGADIEVVLDVVFNHTAESDRDGPIISLRGLDNASYYRLSAENAELINDTGCGNTLACERAPVVDLLMSTMRYFALEAGVDGYRFDLAPVLGRTSSGFSPDAPLLAAIRQDPVLRELRLIAEPWDIGPGGYRLGEFEHPFCEWNDRYRDDVRAFWRGDHGTIGSLATRLSGSQDIFGRSHRRPSASVNFVAAHDGFTLRDLVSFTRKHNEENGESNRDGTDGNLSWNHGVEGRSEDAGIEALRNQDIRALLTTLLLSRGTPMLTAGDEFGRTQSGNNNAYAQDNSTTWLDWAGRDRSMEDFLAALSQVRQSLSGGLGDRFLTGSTLQGSDIADVQWLRADGGAMSEDDWRDGHFLAELLAFQDGPAKTCQRIYIGINRAQFDMPVVMPKARPGRSWRLCVDSGRGFVDAQGEIGSPGQIGPRSVIVLREFADADT